MATTAKLRTNRSSNQLSVEVETPAPSLDSPMMACEMVAGHRRMIDAYRRDLDLQPQEAAKAHAESADYHRQRALNCEPDQLTWAGINELYEHDPAVANRRWGEVVDCAADELRCGKRASAVFETQGSDPWQRAQFLAMRNELSAQWNPRNGIERVLIDAMAQAQSAYAYWTQCMMERATLEPETGNCTKHKGKWKLPSDQVSRAVQQAAEMADRFSRMFVRNLRALRDLRRLAPTIVVQNAGQVNVGEQQVNVTDRPPPQPIGGSIVDR